MKTILIYIVAFLFILPSWAEEKTVVKIHKDSGIMEVVRQGVSKFYRNIADSETLHHLMFWQSEESLERDDDPLEGFNRAMYGFNSALDKIALKPTAKIYRSFIPDIAKAGTGNFFANIADVNTGINQLLQFKLLDSVSSLGRLLVNSTIGIGGVIEVLERPKEKEDLGQTLGVWGVGSGYYLVLPFLGPSSMRDAFGSIGNSLVNDSILSEITQNNDQKIGLVLSNATNIRAILLPLTDLLEKSDDPYVSVRNTYLQRRVYSVADGKIELDDEEF